MGQFLESNMLWIGIVAAFAVTLLVLQKPPHDIAAAAATLAALVAVVAVYYQGYLTWLTHGIDVLRAYDDRYDSKEYRDKRKEIAGNLLRLSESLLGGFSGLNDQADEILDFFTTIGLLTRRKVIDKTMVWALFLYPIHGYWLVAKDSLDRRRDRKRNGDPTMYADFVWLHDAVIRIEKRKRGCADKDIDPANPIEFLKKEAAGLGKGQKLGSTA